MSNKMRKQDLRDLIKLIVDDVYDDLYSIVKTCPSRSEKGTQFIERVTDRIVCTLYDSEPVSDEEYMQSIGALNVELSNKVSALEKENAILKEQIKILSSLKVPKKNELKYYETKRREDVKSVICSELTKNLTAKEELTEALTDLFYGMEESIRKRKKAK